MVTISKLSKKKLFSPSSSQTRSALFYILAITVALLLLNLYTSKNSKILLFKARQTDLQSKAQIVVSSFTGIDELTTEYLYQMNGVLADINVSRLVIVNEGGYCLWDSSDENEVSQLILYPEIVTALQGKDVFTSSYSKGVTTAKYAVPIMYYDNLIGCIYILDFEKDQSSLIYSLEKSLLYISLILEASVVLVAAILSLAFSARTQRILESFPHIRSGEYSYKINLSGSDELAQVAGEFDKLTDKLEEAETSRRRFVSDASHELKTPLASIMLLSETLLESNMDGETEHEFISDINTEANRLNRLTQKLLLLSKSDSAVTDVDKAVVTLQAVAERVIRMLRPVASQRKIQIIGAFSENCSVLASEDDVYQIIFNLVENAIKYNKDGGTVVLKTVRDQDDVKLIVTDTGVGIPEDAQSHIFERFYRVDKARSRAAGGSGLGLSIVHDLVINNFGTIEVGNSKPNGSVFTVTLPYFGVEGNDIT